MSPTPIKVIFLGTPLFSVPTLEALIEAGKSGAARSPQSDIQINLLAVVTPLDKPAGRGQKLTPPAVKVRAEEAGIPVYQTKSIRKDEELQQTLKTLAPDFFVTIAFGQILSQEVLDIPVIGTVNVHASLLPELRGANPIQWAILQNKTETGITTMLTDIGVDTGDMLLKETIPIGENETLTELTIRLSQVGGPLLVKTLIGMKDGSVKPVPQNHDASTHAPKIDTKNDKNADVIDWSKDAQGVHNHIRAFNSGTAFLAGKRVKLSQSRLSQPGSHSENNMNTDEPGRILGIMKEAEPSRLRIATGKGVVEVECIQPEGKRAMAVRDWANGLGQPLEQLQFESSPSLEPNTV